MATITNPYPEPAYTVDVARPYFGETVTFFIRLAGWSPGVGPATVRVYLPEALAPVLETGSVEPAMGPSGPTRFGLRYRLVAWSLPNESESREYRLTARVTTRSLKDLQLKSWAELLGADGAVLAQSEVVTVQVLVKARLLTYLPDIYHDEANALLWRYLMLFDRTLARYEELLSTLPYHFDPHLAPPNFQAWLAAWVGLAPPDHHQTGPEDGPAVTPALLPKMAALYRKRGTRPGLAEILLTLLDLPDEHLSIEENLAGNFVLGDDALLDDDLFIGGLPEETCHFTVTLTWPGPPPAPKVEAWLRAIIQAWKPAHTTFDLRLTANHENNAGTDSRPSPNRHSSQEAS